MHAIADYLGILYTLSGNNSTVETIIYVLTATESIWLVQLNSFVTDKLCFFARSEERTDPTSLNRFALLLWSSLTPTVATTVKNETLTATLPVYGYA